MAPPAKILKSWSEGVSLLRAQSPAIRTMIARAMQAEGLSQQALGRLLPSVSVVGTFDRHLILGEGNAFLASGIRQGTIPSPPQTVAGTLGVVVPVFAPRQWFDKISADRGVDSAAAATKDVERVTLAALADAIGIVVTAERVVDISGLALRSALVTLQLTENTAKLGGKATKLDVLRASQEVSLSRTQLLRAREGLLRAREALGTIFGESVGWGVTRELKLDALLTDRPFVCQRVAAIEQRDDVRRAQIDALISARNVRSVDYSLFPVLQAVSGLSYLSNGAQSPNGRHVTWTVGALFSWQLYDGTRSGQRHFNEGAQRVAEEGARDVSRQANLEATQTQRAVDLTEASLKVSAARREAAMEADHLSRVAFTGGVITNLELTDATRRWREAEFDLAINEFDVVRARLANHFALASCDL